MKVVWKNPHLPEASREHELVKCECCGKTGFPYNEWRAIEFGVGWTEAGWDYTYWMCSDECEKVAKEGLLLERKRVLNKNFESGANGKMPKWLKEILWPT